MNKDKAQEALTHLTLPGKPHHTEEQSHIPSLEVTRASLGGLRTHLLPRYGAHLLSSYHYVRKSSLEK